MLTAVTAVETMPDSRHGSGVLFYDKTKRLILFCLRDNKPSIPFPNHVDILGGLIEQGETPEQTVAREMAEELDDLRSGCPYVLKGHRFFGLHIDERRAKHYIFCKEADFDLCDVRLKEGRGPFWLCEEEAGRTHFAFGFNQIVGEFFRSLRDGRL